MYMAMRRLLVSGLRKPLPAEDESSTRGNANTQYPHAQCSGHKINIKHAGHAIYPDLYMLVILAPQPN